MKRLLAALLMLARYARDFARANLSLAAILLSPRPRIAPAELRVPVRASSDLEVMILSNLISFTPGTLALDFTPGEEVVVHTIDPALADESTILENLERPLLRVTRGHD